MTAIPTPEGLARFLLTLPISDVLALLQISDQITPSQAPFVLNALVQIAAPHLVDPRANNVVQLDQDEVYVHHLFSRAVADYIHARFLIAVIKEYGNGNH